MKQSFKPMIYTFIPIIIIFGWLNANMAFDPLPPGEEFSVVAVFGDDVPFTEATLSFQPEGLVLSDDSVLTQELVNNKAVWKLGGKEGIYQLKVSFASGEETKELLVSDRRYVAPMESYKSDLKSITLSNSPLHPFGDFNLFGWFPGWIGTYIIFSLLFSFGFRRLLKLA